MVEDPASRRDPPDRPPEAEEPGARGGLPARRLEGIIRRAAELQFAEGDGGEDLLSEEEVLRIGREVGLEPRHVRRALGEARADDLVPEAPEDAGTLRRLWGVAVVQVTRVVPGDPAEVRRAVEAHLVARQSLRAVRRRRGSSVWEASEGLVDKMQRALDVAGRGYELAEARRIGLSVSGLEAGRTLVTLTADLRNVRLQQAVNWGSGSAAVFAGAGVLLGLGLGVPWVLAAAAALAGAAGTTSVGGARTFERSRERLRTAMEGLLDRLEAGTLEADGPNWKRRLLG